MADLQQYWNKSSSTIPDDKDPSAYAVEKEQFFPRQAVVLDLGGGSGADSLYFAGRGHSVKLVDISDVALGRAKSIAENKGLATSIETFQANLDEATIPLQSGTCDVVYSRLALHYFGSDTLAKLFTEVYRVLKTGGKAYLTVKSPDDTAEMEYLKQQATEVEDGVFNEGGYTKTRFSVEQLKAVLANAGIPEASSSVQQYTEDLGGRKDKVKSGNTKLTVNQIELTKFISVNIT